TFGGMRVVNHVPYHAFGNGGFVHALHAYRNCASAGERSLSPARDPGYREVVTKHRNARSTQIADNCLEIFQLLLLPWPVKQHVVPVRRIEILDRRQFEAFSIDLLLQRLKLLE